VEILNLRAAKRRREKVAGPERAALQ